MNFMNFLEFYKIHWSVFIEIATIFAALKKSLGDEQKAITEVVNCGF